MKRKIRIIPRLEIKNNLLIKGINLEGLRVLGEPHDFAQEYYNQGADELYFVNVVSTLYGTKNNSTYIKKACKNFFVPMNVGGGIKNIYEIEELLKSGADKVCINSSAIENINFIKKASKIFGSSTICSLIEIVKIGNKYYISKSNGRDLIDTDPILWAKKLECAGSGELILLCVNKEGLQSGFDCEIISKISKSVYIPTIACGGAGSLRDIYDVVKSSEVTGIALSSLLHYNIVNKFNFKNKKIGNTKYLNGIIKNKKKTTGNIILQIKNFLKSKGYETS